MPVELTFTLKDVDKKLTKDFIIYEIISMVDDDPIIMECLKNVMADFKGTPDDIKVKAIMVLN